MVDKNLIISLIVTFIFSASSFSNKEYIQPIDSDGDLLYDQTEEKHNKTSKQELYNLFINSFEFIKIWESDSSPNGVFDAAIEDLDKDGLNDIVFPSYVSNSWNAVLNIYENFGDNSFKKVWVSDSLQTGIIISLAVDDIDSNSFKEIYAGHYSDKIRIFENGGDNKYSQKPYINVDNSITFGDIAIADTDNDNQKEIVIVKGGTGEGYFAIYKNNEKVFDEETNIYNTEVAVGFLDPDPFQDIVICHGGWGSENLWIDLFEFNGTTYEKKAITLTGLKGLPTTAEIADINLDGTNELVVAGDVNGDRKVLIIKADGDDQYSIIDSITYGLGPTPTPMDISIKDILGSDYPEIAVCTHGFGGFAQVLLFHWENGRIEKIFESGKDFLDSSQTSFFNIYLTFADPDTLPDILLAVGAPYDKAMLFEYQPNTSIHNQIYKNQVRVQLVIRHNVISRNISIRYNIKISSNVILDIYNIQGKKVCSLVNSFKNAGIYEINWNGMSINGGKFSNGCYFVQLVSGNEEIVERIIISR